MYSHHSPQSSYYHFGSNRTRRLLKCRLPWNLFYKINSYLRILVKHLGVIYYIYILCMSVCLFVCLTSKRPKFCVGSQGRFMENGIFKKFSSKKIWFFGNFENPRIFLLNPLNFLVCFYLKCKQRAHVHNWNRRWTRSLVSYRVSQKTWEFSDEFEIVLVMN